MKFVALGLVFAMGAAVPVSAKNSSRATTKKPRESKRAPVWIQIGKAKLQAEVVDNDSLRTLGLSNRQKLDWNAGMLFVFPDAAQRAFWMIDCWLDLDIAYLDGRGVVRDIQTMVIEPGVRPEALRRYPSATSDIVYALETNRGWMAANGVKIGQKVPAIAAFKTRI